MQNTPFFSIITCTYNSAKHISDNIKSIKSQTFVDYEQIFIDGFSSDKTIEFFNYYKSSNGNVKIIQSEAKGIANAMNIGINNAQGKYLLFLNSDDYLSDNQVLQKVSDYINSNKKYSWYYGMVNAISETGDKLYVYPHRKYQKIYCFWIFRFTFFMQHPATFYSRDLFSKYGLYDESINAMDYEYAVRIGKKEKAKFMDIMVSDFRVGGFSSKNRRTMEEDVRSIIKRYFSLSGLWFFIRKLYIKFFVKNY